MKKIKKIVLGIFLFLFNLDFVQEIFCSNDSISPVALHTGFSALKLPFAVLSDYHHYNDEEKKALIYDSLYHATDILSTILKYVKKDDTFCVGDIVVSGYDLCKLASNISKLSKIDSPNEFYKIDEKTEIKDEKKEVDDDDLEESLELGRRSRKAYVGLKYFLLLGSLACDLYPNFSNNDMQKYDKWMLSEISVFSKLLSECFDLKTLKENNLLAGGAVVWFLVISSYYQVLKRKENRYKKGSTQIILSNGKTINFDLNNNYYNMLGLNEDSSTEQIKEAFRQTILRCDFDPNDEQFRNLCMAYWVLSDPVSRSRYNDFINKKLLRNIPEPWVKLTAEGIKQTREIRKRTTIDSRISDYYKILGISPNASPKEINDAYIASYKKIDSKHQIILKGIVDALLEPDKYLMSFYDMSKFRWRDKILQSDLLHSFSPEEIFYFENGRLGKLPPEPEKYVKITQIGGDTYLYNSNNNYYRVLGVPQKASLDEINKAFLELKSKVPLSETLRVAYATLIKPEVRVSYDNFLREVSLQENSKNYFIGNGIVMAKEWSQISAIDIEFFDKERGKVKCDSERLDYFKLLGLPQDASESDIKRKLEDYSFKLRQYFKDPELAVQFLGKNLNQIESIFSIISNRDARELYLTILKSGDLKNDLALADLVGSQILCENLFGIRPEQLAFFKKIGEMNLGTDPNVGKNSSKPAIDKTECLNILGLPKNALQKDIKKAYKKFALKYHPDRNLGKEKWAADEFKKINDAYKILIDENKTRSRDEKQNGSQEVD